MAKDKIIRQTGRAKAHQKYITSDGRVVPGGSTIARMVNYGNCDGLMWWGIKLDRQEIDPKQAREEAADFGKCFHRAVECQFKGERFDEEAYPGAYVEPSKKMRDNFFALLDEMGLVMVGSEEQITSDKEGWGGTLDLLLTEKILLPDLTPTILGDLKSSNSISAEHVVQVAGAYAPLFFEKYGKRPKRVILFRAERNAPHDVTQHTIRGEQMEAAVAAARLGRELWTLKPIVTKGLRY